MIGQRIKPAFYLGLAQNLTYSGNLPVINHIFTQVLELVH